METWKRNCYVSSGIPSMVYKGHLKFYTSVYLINSLYGSLNRDYIAYKMDSMCVRYSVSVINNTGCIPSLSFLSYSASALNPAHALVSWYLAMHSFQ